MQYDNYRYELGLIDNIQSYLIQEDKNEKLLEEIFNQINDLIENPSHIPYVLEIIDLEIINNYLNEIGFELLDYGNQYKIVHHSTCKQGK